MVENSEVKNNHLIIGGYYLNFVNLEVYPKDTSTITYNNIIYKSFLG